MNVHAQQRSYVTLITAAHFLSDFYNNFLPPLLPIVIANLNISLTTSGLLVMIYSFTSSILQPLWGYFIDRGGYSWLILVTVPISALFICLSGSVANQYLLFFYVAVAGLGSSLFHPLGSSFIDKVASPGTKGISLSVFIGGGNFGFALAPAFLVYFLMQQGLNHLLWLALPSVLFAFISYVYRLHHFQLATPRTMSHPESKAWYRCGNIIKLNVVMGLRSWAQVALGTLIPVWYASQGHSPYIAGMMLTAYLLSGAIGGFIGGYLGDRWGRKTCIIGSLLIGVPAVFIFCQSTQITALTWISLCLSGGALQAALPSSIVWAQDMLPANAAMASGMMLGLAFGLGGVGTALTGALADHIGLGPALLWTVLPLAVSIPIALTIPPRTTKYNISA